MSRKYLSIKNFNQLNLEWSYLASPPIYVGEGATVDMTKATMGD